MEKQWHHMTTDERKEYIAKNKEKESDLLQRRVILPVWTEVRRKLENNEYVNPLEDFIINYEPLNDYRKETFRLLLQNAINFIKAR